MAVPPADDGTVAVTDVRAARPRVSSTLTILSVAFAVVAVACLGVLVVRYATDTEGSSVGDRTQQLFGAQADVAGDDATGREAVMSQANQFMLRINTYGPSDLDKQNALPGYVTSVHEVITPKFAVSFDQNVTLAAQSVSQAGYARTADLFSTGVDTIDTDSATVLVSGVIKSSYPDSRRNQGRIQYPAQPFRVSVALVKIEGAWLVDDFTPVTDGSSDPQSGLPTTPPTSKPSGAPTSKPSGAPTSKPSGAPTSKPSGTPTQKSSAGSGGAKP